MSGEQRKWRLDDGIAELKRELDYRVRTYPQLLARGSLSEDEVRLYTAALKGTLEFVEFCKTHEDVLRAFMKERIR